MPLRYNRSLHVPFIKMELAEARLAAYSSLLPVGKISVPALNHATLYPEAVYE